MATDTLDPVRDMAKAKRNDSSAKIDSEVLLRIQIVVLWRKHNNEADEHLTVAQYISEMLREHSAPEYEEAVKWHSQQLRKKKAE